MSSTAKEAIRPKSLTLGEARELALRILREAELRRTEFAEEEAKHCLAFEE